MSAERIDTGDFDGRRTLIVGDVNSGKTRFTEAVLVSWTAQGRSPNIAVMDLAPETRQGIGGRLRLPEGYQGIYLATSIAPPRLQGRSEKEADALAAANAAAIAPLLADPGLTAAPILVVNDATLYLQAGDYDRLLHRIRSAGTVLMNAYYGASFPNYRLSQRERRLTERLMKECDRIIHLPAPGE